jgi:CDP-diacylglycerol--glycerol-3-phosphate 3-phosphatidyltransferase
VNAPEQAGPRRPSYQDAVRRVASRWVAGLERTPITPDALTISGVGLCIAGAVAVYFEYESDWFFILGGALFVIGSILDILDGALARRSGKGTPFGAFLDSTVDRVGELFMLSAIGLVLMRDGSEWGVGLAFVAIGGSFLVSYTRARAEAIGIKADVGFGSRAERVVVISVGLALAPFGSLPYVVAVLAVTAWLTVLQRILFVRNQLLRPR